MIHFGMKRGSRLVCVLVYEMRPFPGSAVCGWLQAGLKANAMQECPQDAARRAADADGFSVVFCITEKQDPSTLSNAPCLGSVLPFYAHTRQLTLKCNLTFRIRTDAEIP